VGSVADLRTVSERFPSVGAATADRQWRYIARTSPAAAAAESEAPDRPGKEGGEGNIHATVHFRA
jgi:hypothetical protein